MRHYITLMSIINQGHCFPLLSSSMMRRVVNVLPSEAELTSILTSRKKHRIDLTNNNLIVQRSNETKKNGIWNLQTFIKVYLVAFDDAEKRCWKLCWKVFEPFSKSKKRQERKSKSVYAIRMFTECNKWNSQEGRSLICRCPRRRRTRKGEPHEC